MAVTAPVLSILKVIVEELYGGILEALVPMRRVYEIVHFLPVAAAPLSVVLEYKVIAPEGVAERQYFVVNRQRRADGRGVGEGDLHPLFAVCLQILERVQLY